jgi:CRISPR-associated protein Cmr1
MMAQRPSKPAALSRRKNDDVASVEFEFSVGTPVFGGGVRINQGAPHKKELDRLTPVRGAAVRGQLRFWWRATHGCTAEKRAEMKAREDALWGAASTPGKVSLQISWSGGKVEPVPVYTPQDPRKPLPSMTGIAYGAFPLQAAQGAVDKESGSLSGVTGSFVLKVTGPAAQKEEVQDAVTAWLLFGGVGGRARRGFGTLAARDLPPALTFLERFRAEKTLAGVPSLHGARLVQRAGDRDSLKAWSVALSRLKDFRQKGGFARNPGTPPRAGRSRWPEPDFIRKVTRRASREHGQALVRIDKAPRAVFGLPIITHFKDEKQGDPKQSTLLPIDAEGRQLERMASPLIIKAIKQGDQWLPSCLRLADPGRSSLVVGLFQDKRELTRPPWTLDRAEAEQIEPLRGRSSDVLDAFLTYFAEH